MMPQDLNLLGIITWNLKPMRRWFCTSWFFTLCTRVIKKTFIYSKFWVQCNSLVLIWAWQAHKPITFKPKAGPSSAVLSMKHQGPYHLPLASGGQPGTIIVAPEEILQLPMETCSGAEILSNGEMLIMVLTLQRPLVIMQTLLGRSI